MPLLTSPIDGSPMRQIHRYGIEIDVCPTTGGVWLDKGELEKLIYLLQEDVAGEQSNQRPVNASNPKKFDRDWDDYDDDDRYRYEKHGYHGSGKHKKKEGKVSRIMDMFDF